VGQAGDFWAWGPGSTDGDVWVVVVSDPTLPELRQAWRDVRVAAVMTDARRVSEERTVYVVVVRGIRVL
jgi:hypothetical protein